jgi:hypothetical protein
MTGNTTVDLNQDVGCYILTFLDGIDAVNFIDAVNDSQQFGSIAKTSDHNFIELIKVFCEHPRIPLSSSVLYLYFTDEYEIVDGRLILASKRYSDVKQPHERLYIHSCFSIEGFTQLCKVYGTPLFKCFSRLLPLNNVSYNADFGLLNYEWYSHTIGSERILNDHEKKLFKGRNYSR